MAKLNLNEDAKKTFLEEADSYFNRFVTDRYEIDQKNRIADYMYACAQNRAIMSSEKSKGMDKETDTRASVGSVLFFRQVNQMSAQLVSVMKSRPDLWKYNTMSTDGVAGSMDDGLDRANQAMALSRWTRKQDQFDRRLPEFAVSLYKYSNVPMFIQQKRTYATEQVTTPIIEEVGQDQDGLPITKITGEKTTRVNTVKDNYPTVVFPHLDMVYADRWIPDFEGQNCIVLLTLRNRSNIYGDVADGWFDKKEYEKLTKDDEWNGTYGTNSKKEEALNRGEMYNPSGTGQFLQWDIFMRAPIKGSNWDEKNPPQIVIMTIIGNTILDGKIMRVIENYDPDGEMPAKMIHCNPDSYDCLYHTTNAEIIRSHYSVDCTLLNLAIDNMGTVNDPPMTIIDGEHRIRDFTFKKGQRWHVNRHDAVKQFEIRDNTIQTFNLRNQIQTEAKQALATDPSMMGEYAGARTSASEFIGVAQNTKQPHMFQIGYILDQMLPWMADKYLTYWQAFGLPDQVIQIADSEKKYRVNPKAISGEYDVTVDIIDEYEEDLVKAQKLSQIIQIFGSVPYFQQSPTHTTDAGELMKQLLDFNKLDSSKIILPPQGVDAEAMAHHENDAMLNTGTYIRPQQGQNHSVHLRVHEAEKIRWQGLEDSGDQRAINTQLIQQHIDETKQMAGAQAGSAPPASPSGNQTSGEVVGNDQAGALGAMMGGQQ